MRAVTNYNYSQPRNKKIKSVLLVALFLAIAFLAGAVAERTGHILQEAEAVLPGILDGTELFLREKIFIKVVDIVEQIKLFVVITSLIIKEFFSGLIRGP